MDKIKVELISADKLSDVQVACEMTRSMGKYGEPADFTKKEYWTNEKLNKILHLPHSKIARFTDFKFIITGSSRRFLSQLITHHIGCDIMSGSLQYSDLSNLSMPIKDMFVVPYEIICHDLRYDNDNLKSAFLNQCTESWYAYKDLRMRGIDNDTAGYLMPMASRNNLLVKVNLEELMYIANQRLCRRNTSETRYVVGLMVEEVIKQLGIDDELFMPTCYSRPCQEGKYSCGCPVNFSKISELLDFDFQKIRNGRKGN